MRRTCLVIILLLMYVPAWGATYYVDATGGNDSNNGTAINNAWKTISKVNNSSFTAGDLILFKRGETWREQLAVPSSGKAGSVITFGAYGTGSAPIIDASDIITPGTSWTKDVVGGDIWTATVTTKPNIVFFNGVKGTKVASKTACNGERKWYWAGNVLSIYSTTDPDTAYTAPGIEVGTRDQAGYIDKNYVTFDGLHFTRGNDNTNVGAIYNNGGTHVTVQNSEMSWSANRGFVQSGTSADTFLSNNDIHDNHGEGIFIYKDSATAGHENIISNNRIHNNYLDGIMIWSNYCIIDNNTVYNNGNWVDALIGIHIFDPENDGYGRHNIVKHNKVYGQKSGMNNGEGIVFDDYSAYNTAYYNISYGNDGPGIGIWMANNNTVYNNTIYGNSLNSGGALASKAEIIIDAFEANLTDNNVIKNNIAYATQANTYVVWVGPNSINSKGLNITNNEWYATATNWYYWNAIGGNNLTTWNALRGVGTDLNSDPLFISTVTPDFYLQASSPAINAGVNVGLTRDYEGNAVPFGAFPDIGAFEYQVTKIPSPPNLLIIK